MMRSTGSQYSSFIVRQALVVDIPVLAHHRGAMFHDMGKLASQRMPDNPVLCRRRCHFRICSPGY